MKLLLFIIVITILYLFLRNREHLGEHVGYYSRVNNTLLADQAGIFNNIRCKYDDATDRVHCVRTSRNLN